MTNHNDDCDLVTFVIYYCYSKIKFLFTLSLRKLSFG